MENRRTFTEACGAALFALAVSLPLFAADVSPAAAEKALREGDRDRAIDLLRRYAREKPKETDAPSAWFRSCEISTDFQDAVTAYEELADRFPDYPRVPEALLRAGKLYYLHDIRSPATRVLRRLATEYPKSPLAGEAATLVGQLRLVEEKPDEAIAELDAVIRDYPSSPARPWAMLGKAHALFEKELYHGALDAYTVLLVTDDGGETNPPALYRIGECYEKLDRFEEALSVYEELGKRFPDSPEATLAGSKARFIQSQRGAEKTRADWRAAGAKKGKFFTVQCGSFRDTAAAQRLVDELGKKGFRGRIVAEKTAGGQRQRVRLRRFEDEKSAVDELRKVRAAGWDDAYVETE